MLSSFYEIKKPLVVKSWTTLSNTTKHTKTSIYDTRVIRRRLLLC